MNIVERLQEVQKFSGLSVRALAAKCSLKQQTLDKHIKGEAEPSLNTVMALASAFPEISTDWILLGKGPMLKTDKEVERINSLLDTITTLQDTINAQRETITALSERLKQNKNG